MNKQHPGNPASFLRVEWAAVKRSSACVLLALSLLGCSSTQQPAERPTTRAANSLDKIIVSRPADYRTVAQAWGQLTWFVSAEQGNCDTMTVGQATLKPGMESPRHVHPNCDEVLHVVKGTILHAVDDGKQVKMSAGDTVTIPMGIAHNAKNIGTDEAVMIISFSSAHRKVVNE